MFSPPLVTLAAASAPVVTVSLTLLLITVGIALCVWVGHRWSTLIVGLLIGLFLTGTGFANGTRKAVTTVATTAINALSEALQ
ncbi:hypothetical protein GCM10010218_24560 [Streptomyces mashuensis]|uniref:Uncharacterized protein n=1 Tax=Streptomyces mashuensis TaxID=33904 RepID=A0A919B252_9ACTN|nr:hypothetical protein [Streptomyces mashuensis]GHF42496.1 hypothetical protein GCM10010218_24560 [Streptomyces mashuensis]